MTLNQRFSIVALLLLGLSAEAKSDAAFLSAVAEVERLPKAGDKLVEVIQEMDVIIDMDSDHPEVKAWNAAKEGKPSV